MAKNDIAILSLRGGMNDEDPAPMLAEDQCTLADNVEWFFSTVGERRAGMGPLDLTGSGLSATGSIVHLSQWYPTNDVANPELWAVGATPGDSGKSIIFARRNGGGTGQPTWTQVVPAGVTSGAVQSAPTANIPDIYSMVTQALNSKLFWAYNTGIDRCHVWDGSGLRLTGLRQPDAPTAAAEGVGTFATVRYYRYRLIAKDANNKIVRRSEPSTAVTYTPAGTELGATIARATTANALNSNSDEGQTHWELEASTDNANFYVIQTLAFATLTANDELASTAYSTFTLSEAIGAYILQPSAKFLAADDDRLLFAGHFFDKTLMSTIRWSPSFNDPGTGNDERFPIVDTGGNNITSSINLDNAAGGPITGISNGVNGTWYAFKWTRIYRCTRTFDPTQPYAVKCISTLRGAVPGSVFEGIDESGAACVYFYDPFLGPSRVGGQGVQRIRGLRTTCKRVNLKADVIARGVFYPFKQQAIWCVAVDGAVTPTLGLRCQVSELRVQAGNDVGRGWSRFDGKAAQAVSMTTYTEWVSDGGTVTLSLRPFFGLASPDFIQRTDVDITDNGTTYVAKLVTHPFVVTGLLQKWGAMMATMLSTALSGATVVVRFIRDMGVETTGGKTVTMTPVGSESLIINDLDDLDISEARTIQIQISDT